MPDPGQPTHEPSQHHLSSKLEVGDTQPSTPPVEGTRWDKDKAHAVGLAGMQTPHRLDDMHKRDEEVLDFQRSKLDYEKKQGWDEESAYTKDTIDLYTTYRAKYIGNKLNDTTQLPEQLYDSDPEKYAQMSAEDFMSEVREFTRLVNEENFLEAQIDFTGRYIHALETALRHKNPNMFGEVLGESRSDRVNGHKNPIYEIGELQEYLTATATDAVQYGLTDKLPKDIMPEYDRFEIAPRRALEILLSGCKNILPILSRGLERVKTKKQKMLGSEKPQGPEAPAA